MSLASGTQFNSYLIGESIGVGGMGEVYRATDTKLKRDVAIKVLPESFATDAERVARFQREAELLAALNHPGIAQIFGLEQANGVTALVMELIDGPTLAERLEQGPIPHDEALNIALNIADALEAAHERGIVHRDLKPANIKLKNDGRVKVLDFGIAKSVDNQASNSGLHSPQLTTPAMTQSGMILGTAAYMSPEQARGKPVDRRTDIWAFGCVLYEMLTGQPAFGGEDVQETIARVITNKLELKTLPKGVPPAVKQALELCLVKDPKKRIADISDVRLVLKGAFGASEAEAVANTPQPFWRRMLPLAGALVLGGMVVGVALWFALPPETQQPLNRFAYPLPDEAPFNIDRNVFAVSPDGRRFAYATSAGLYLRELGELEARLIPGTENENPTMPFFSPDGQAIAYVPARPRYELKRIAISGGASAVIIGGFDQPHGAWWAQDDSIFLSTLVAIVRVPATGGPAEVVVEARAGEQLASPELLPDGDTLIFTVTTEDSSNWVDAKIVAQSLRTGERTVLVEGGNNAHYLPDGHLLYALGDVLFGVAFDVDSLTVTGGAVPLVQPISRASVTDAANYGVSRDGSLLYMNGLKLYGLRTLVWVDRTGAETALAIEPSNYVYPRISPDGTQVALDDRNTDNDIWVWDFAAETRTRLTIGSRGSYYPAWTPDGNRIAYYPVGKGTIDWRAANNTGNAETLIGNEQVFGRPGTTEINAYFFAPSGQLVFSPLVSGNRDIGMFTVGSAADVTWLLDEPYTERNAELSPDGRWMAYESNESGIYEVYVRPFPNVDDDRVQVSNAGGMKALWSPDGSELFYLEQTDTDMRLMSVTLEPSATDFRFGARTALMGWPYWWNSQGRTYDVSRDGQRFLALKDIEDGDQEEAEGQVVIVQNWLQELQKLIPVE